MSSGGVLAVSALKFVWLCAGEFGSVVTQVFHVSVHTDSLRTVFFLLLVASARASPATIPEGCEFYAIAADAGRLCCPSFSASIDRGLTVRTWPHVSEACGARFPHLLASATSTVAPAGELGLASVAWPVRVACVAVGGLVCLAFCAVGVRCVILCRRRSQFARTDLLPGYVRAQSASTLLAGRSMPDFSSCKISVGPSEPDIEEELGYLAVRFDALDRRIRGGGVSRFVSLLSPPAQSRGRLPGIQECAAGNCGTGGGLSDTHCTGDFETMTSATSTFCDSYVLPRR